MFGSLLILLAMPVLDTCRIRGNQFRPLSRFVFWLFVVDFLILLWIGAKHPEYTYSDIGTYATIFYFSYFLILVPGVGIIENTLMDVAINNNNKK